MFVKEKDTEGDGVFVQKECVIELFEGMHPYVFLRKYAWARCETQM